ncbi:MAG TPA: site-specific DNA-methyltransferase [Firmicutes bacterium]|nr:site-specific DNA-methyltransferase [Bacillota bacterium]
MRSEVGDRTGVALQVNGNMTTLRWDDGEETEVETDRLIAVCTFGDPIYPGLRTVGKIQRGGNKPFHTVINAENYHALRALRLPLSGQVDVMYLDPPYNSGARDWTYNNDYVDSTDAYRHSKWLSFMEKRLRLARPLLRKDAVMVVTIDEHEVSRLGVLLDQLFPEADITLVTIVINTKGVTRAGVPRFSRVEEYAYFCFFGNAGIYSIGDDLLTGESSEKESLDTEASETVQSSDTSSDSDEPMERTGPGWRKLLRSGDDPRRIDRKNMFYPIWINPKTRRIVRVGEPLLPVTKPPSFEPDEDQNLPVWPIRGNVSEGRWGVGADTLRSLVERGFVRIGRYQPKRKTWGVSYLTEQIVSDIDAGKYDVSDPDPVTGVVQVWHKEGEAAQSERKIKTVWFRKRHNAGVGGTTLVSELVGDDRPFSFPKSVFAVRDTIAILTRDKTDAVVLDFFGGSGTTTHAVAMLNQEDGGTRRSILVTNNEVDSEEQVWLRESGIFPGDPDWETRGIFYRATKPRLEAAFTGKRHDGTTIPAHLKNFDGSLMLNGLEENIEFFELEYLDRNTVSHGRAFEAIAPLLWMLAGSTGERISEPNSSFALPEGGRYGVLFNASHYKAFAKALDDREDVTHAFVVTDSHAQFQQIAAELPAQVKVSMLYEDYLRNFEFNTGGSLF